MPFDNTPLRDPVTERIGRAIACLEERGWCQRESSDADGRVCLVGAFWGSSIAGDDPAITNEALRRVAHLVGYDVYCLGQWNDSLLALAGKWAVLDVLRRAAAGVE